MLVSKEGDQLLKTPVFISLLILSSAAIAQNPVPRVGNVCPGGTYRSGDYCIPKSGEVVVQKSGNICPSGFKISGNYCVRRSNSDRNAVVKHSEKSCPRGWRKDGEYCVQ